MRFGSFRVPIRLIACGLSVVVHGALFAASYFVTWAPGTVSQPKIELAGGDHAIQVMILSTPFPGPKEEDPTAAGEQDSPSDAPSDIPAVVVDAMTQRVEVAGLPEQRCEPIDEEQARLYTAEPTVGATPAQETVMPHDAAEGPGSSVPERGVGDRSNESPPSFAPSRPEVANGLERVPAKEQRPDSLLQTPFEAQPVGDAPPRRRTLRDEPRCDTKPGAETGVEIVDLPRPRYPSVSRRRGEEGLVLLQVEVLPSGSAGKVKVLRDPGFPRLKRAAIEAVRKARFRPATRGGRPVKATVRIPFRFVLR